MTGAASSQPGRAETVLVLGATGYVGSHAARHLAASGYRVRALCRSAEAATRLQAQGLTPVRGDIVGELETVVARASEADAVLFAPQLMIEPEYKAVVALLDALENSGKTFVFTSGTGIVAKQTGGDWDDEVFAEDDPFVPAKHIARRADTENLVRSAATRGIRAMVVRPPLIWGNGHCPVISAFYESVRQTGSVCYLGRGLNLYSHVHVDDLAELFRLAIEKGTSGALYHVVAGEANNRSIADTIAHKLGVPTCSIGFEEAQAIWGKFLVRVVFNACSRTRSPRSRAELGWHPGEKRLDILDDVVDPAYAETEG